ncbi:MAG: GreA/GreB family elongation factor [Candidatus Shapirobacteria bacterium]
MTPITQLGLDRLKTNLITLKAELVRTFDEKREAAAEGDLKENSAYIFMGERAIVLQTQVEEASNSIKDAVLITPPTEIDIVQIGHKVKVLFNNDQREMTITLVGKDDNAIKPGWVSHTSPIGIALMGKSVNDKVDVNGQMVSVLEISLGEIE